MKNKLKIKVNNYNIEDCNSNITLLDNIINKNLHLNYSCKNGRCDSCKIKILRGNFEIVNQETSLTSKDKNDNYHLSCCIVPKTNIEIFSENFYKFSLPKPIIYPAKVIKIVNHTNLIKSVFLKLPNDSKFEFIEGQFVDIKISSHTRSYSIASFDKKLKTIEIIIKKIKNGYFSKYWFNRCQPNDLIYLIGPKGGNLLNYKKNTHLIFVATGVGIAPILSFLKSKKTYEIYKNISVIWGNRFNGEDFIDIEKIFKKVEFFRSFSKNKTSKYSYVQEILTSQFSKLSNSTVYACGSFSMVKDVRDLCISKNININNFISDAFVQTGDTDK